jgi:hypothetical protein
MSRQGNVARRGSGVLQIPDGYWSLFLERRPACLVLLLAQIATGVREPEFLERGTAAPLDQNRLGSSTNSPRFLSVQ